MREAWRRGPRGARRGGAGRARRARSASSTPRDAGRAAARGAARRRCRAEPGAGCRPTLFFKERVAAGRRRTPTTRTRPPGARSASAGRPARAAMCGWASTGAIPWEAVERKAGATRQRRSGRTAVSADPTRSAARQGRPRARRVPRPAAGCRCASTATTRRSTSPSSAPARAAARSPASWPRPASRSWRFDAGPYWRPLEDFASDEIGSRQALLDRRAHRRRRQPARSSAATTAARRSAAAPCISRWCRCASGPSGSSRAALLGYGVDWPLDWREMWHYYGEVEQALKIAGPVQLSLGPEAAALSLPAARAQRRRPGAGARLPRRSASPGRRRRSPPSRRRAARRTPASIAASARSAARPTPSRACSSPGCRARSRPAPRSATWRWSGASRSTRADRATGVHYHREGRWRFQRARNVVVAGYAIETPRLLLNSATDALPGRARQQLGPGRHVPDGAGQPGGLGHDGGGDPLVQGRRPRWRSPSTGTTRTAARISTAATAT